MEKSILLENASAAAELFGSFDVHAKRIEKAFGVALSCRDSQLKITGEEPGVSKALRTVESLLGLIAKGETLNDFNVVVPTERVKEIKDGKQRIITRRICPGYVILRMALYADAAQRQINQELWQFILNIPGVTGFVGCKRGTNQKPRPISDEEAANLIRRVAAEDKRKPRLKVTFQVGETVRVTEGPFMNFNGVIEQIDPDSGRLQISVSIFGRSAPVTLEYWQVERITEHPEGV